jgi:membrane-bound inhibitor of C-type lysozyme
VRWIALGFAACTLAACTLGACNQPGAPATAIPTAAPAPHAAAGAVNPPAHVSLYHCADGQTIEAGYPDSGSAVVTYKGHAYSLRIARSGSGARYTGMGLQWWTKGLDDGVLSTLQDGEEVASDPGLACSTKGFAAVEPPAPGRRGGLPDDRTPVSEAPFTPTSAQGAANVVQTYFALLGEGKVSAATKLRRPGQPPTFDDYAEIHAQVGAPGDSEGAAGSIFIEVPVVIYGRLKTGAEAHLSGKAVLRRVNDVPGSTAEQRLWHIDSLDLK